MEPLSNVSNSAQMPFLPHNRIVTVAFLRRVQIFLLTYLLTTSDWYRGLDHHRKRRLMQVIARTEYGTTGREHLCLNMWVTAASQWDALNCKWLMYNERMQTIQTVKRFCVMTAGFFVHGWAVAAAETDLWRWHASQQSTDHDDMLIRSVLMTVIYRLTDMLTYMYNICNMHKTF